MDLTITTEEALASTSVDASTTTPNKVMLDRLAKRKLKKQVKREEQKRARVEELIQIRDNNLSIYQLPKRLLIFDLNKVLINRNKGCVDYIPRPHVQQFLQDMSERYTLAVWSSMKRNSAVKVLNELFTIPQVDLLFAWFQNRCVVIKHETELDPQEQTGDPLFDTIKPTFYKKLSQVWLQYPQFNESNTVNA